MEKVGAIMLVNFMNQEQSYKTWLAEHPRGFVFNHFGGNQTGYNLIHAAQCYTLHRAVDEGKRTVIEKICSTDLESLEERVKELRGRSYSYCKVCVRYIE